MNPLPPHSPSQPANTQTQWVRLIVESLIGGGAHDFVISPGSRSTPLVAAILDSPTARTTLVIDERVAAFVALGQARASGRPSVLVCTSGTAPAHYYPALIEASHSCVPLIVLSADRPSELQGNGAPQTIDQHHLFGRHVRLFIDFGVPESSVRGLRGAQRKVAQGLTAAVYPVPGPVHFNVPARKPLEPQPTATDEERALQTRVTAYVEQGVCGFHAPTLALQKDALDQLASVWSGAQRPLLYLGPALTTTALDGIVSFARHTGWPVLAECSHPLKFARPETGPHHAYFELALRSMLEVEPDLAVCVGGTATSSRWLDVMDRESGPEIHVLNPYHWTDASNRARHMIAADPDLVLAALAHRVRPASRAWADCWKRADAAARVATNSFHQVASSTQPFTEATALRLLSKRIAEGDTVVLGNSLTIRLAETFLHPDVACRCITQRGANGIDGLIAGGLGTSTVSGGRTWLILGDVSAMHDMGALRAVAAARPALIICVLDNDGGRLFDELPIAHSAVDLSFWTSPHHSDLAAIARACGLPAWAASSSFELDEALQQASATASPAVLVCKVDAVASRHTYTELTRLTKLAFAPRKMSDIADANEAVPDGTLAE